MVFHLRDGRKRFLWLLLGLLLWTAPLRAEEPLGAVPGEVLKFHIHWMSLPAGKAEMRFLQGETPALFTVEASLESIGMARLFHRVEDFLFARMEKTPTSYQAQYFKKHQLARKGRELTELVFYRQENRAQRVVNERQKLWVDGVTPEHNDVLSAFYSVRAIPDLFTRKEPVPIPLIDSKKIYTGSITVGEKERLYTPVGWVEVYPLFPQLEESRLLRHKGGLTIWLSDDARRLPIRVSAKLRVGTAMADLMYYEDGLGKQVQGEAITTKRGRNP